jgi:hypothetical protein
MPALGGPVFRKCVDASGHINMAGGGAKDVDSIAEQAFEVLEDSGLLARRALEQLQSGSLLCTARHLNRYFSEGGIWCFIGHI